MYADHSGWGALNLICEKLKVEKREINLTHFYGIFYLLASLGLSNPARFDWLCQDLPIPAASLCSLCSENGRLLSPCRILPSSTGNPAEGNADLCVLMFTLAELQSVLKVHCSWWLISLRSMCVWNSQRWVNSFKKSFSMVQMVCKDFKRNLNPL